MWPMKLLIAVLYALTEPSALAFFQLILGSAGGGCMRLANTWDD